MALSRSDVINLVADELFPLWRKERERLDRIDKWYRRDQEKIEIPKRATREMRALAELSKTPWLGLVVTTVAQSMYVDGYHSESTRLLDDVGEQPVGPWRTWKANQFDARQIAVHRAALAYGYSYVSVLPGQDSLGKRSVMRGLSPRKAQAVYADPSEDEWPMYAIRVEPQPKGVYAIRVYDEQDVHYLGMDHSTATPDYISYDTHGAGVCPIVRFANQLDLDGRTDGEVEPFIPMAGRINKTAFDRMLTQHYNSWKVRTVSGLSRPDDDEQANRKKMELRQDDMLVAEDPDTRFGSLDETSLTGFIDAWRSDIEALAAMTQTPTHALTGQVVNVSAEAVAAFRAGLTQKVTERQKAFGPSHVQALQLAAELEGNTDDATDLTARMSWQDMEIRSLSQAVDAYAKAVESLQVPPQALWGRIPGIEQSDVEEWRDMARSQDPIDRMTDELLRQGQGEFE